MSLSDESIKYFDTPIIPKFLATQDEEGKVNVVPVLTIRSYDDKTLVFGNIMLRKTEKNLQKDDRVSVCVFGISALVGMERVPSFEELIPVLAEIKLDTYKVKGRFKGFERAGKYFDVVAGIPMLRYCAYQPLRGVGIIEVEDVRVPFGEIPIEQMMMGTATKISLEDQAEGKMHPNVAEKFNRLVSFRVIATRVAGRPEIIPVLSMKGAGSTLIFGCENVNTQAFEERGYLASSVLTDDAIAYQIKGVFRGFEKTEFGEIGKIDVKEVYSASLPRPGERIDK
jgi:hypothetical protein